jgi:hypothetical protein
MSVSIATSDPIYRVGEIKITMWGPAGKDLCSVQVSAEAKPPKTPKDDDKTGDTTKKGSARRGTGGLKVKKPE